MSNRKVLVLGAGIYQLPLIRCAKQRGNHVIVASWSKNDPGVRLADEYWNIDTRDREQLCELASQHEIEAVTTTGTDVAIPSLGYINESLGLSGITFETALSCSNKILMQRRFMSHGVPSARFIEANTLEQAYAAVNLIGLPVVFKSPDSSGSRGVVVVQAFDAIDSAYEQARSNTSQDTILIEEYLSGSEFGAQAIVQSGCVTHFLCHNDTVTTPPVSVPIGHSCPCSLSPEIQQQARNVTQQAVMALHIKNCICNVDLIMSDKGVRVLELGARAGATGLPEIIQLHFGIDLYELALKMALGESFSIRPSSGPAAAVLIIRAPETGHMVQYRIPEAILRSRSVARIRVDYEEGQYIHAFKTGPDRIGEIIVTADTVPQAEMFARYIDSQIDFTIDVDKSSHDLFVEK